MVNNPAVLISDDLIATLEKEALFERPFEELTGTTHPWEVQYATIRTMRADLQKTELGVRQAYPDRDVTCVLSGTGAYWLPRGGLEKFLKELNIPLKQLKITGPLPVWKLTTGEIFSSHISNMRQLILAVSHDLVLLDQLHDSLGANHDFLHREFERCERSVRVLLAEIKNQGPNLANAVSESMMLFERARITEAMLDRGEITVKDLGYNLEDLHRAQELLDKRCRKELPAYQQRIQAAYNQMQNALRGGESTQLSRASRWEFAFSLMGTAPKGYEGQMIVSEKERDGLMTVVASREEELGESELGKTALADAHEAMSAKGVEPEAPVEVAIDEPSAPEPQTKKKSVTRMAFTSRHSR